MRLLRWHSYYALYLLDSRMKRFFVFFQITFPSNPLLQLSHLYGFSPLCILSWSTLSQSLENSLSQNPHTKPPFFFMNIPNMPGQSCFLLEIIVVLFMICFQVMFPVLSQSLSSLDSWVNQAWFFALAASAFWFVEGHLKHLGSFVMASCL